MDASADERRLTSRVLRHWTEMAMAQSFPRFADIDPWLVGDDWAHCILLRHDAIAQRWQFVVVGEKLAPPSEHRLEGRLVEDCPSETLLSNLLVSVPMAVSARAPMTLAGSANHGATRVVYRAVLLPLSEDGIHIDGMLGAANCRDDGEGSPSIPFRS